MPRRGGSSRGVEGTRATSLDHRVNASGLSLWDHRPVRPADGDCSPRLWDRRATLWRLLRTPSPPPVSGSATAAAAYAGRRSFSWHQVQPSPARRSWCKFVVRDRVDWRRSCGGSRMSSIRLGRRRPPLRRAPSLSSAGTGPGSWRRIFSFALPYWVASALAAVIASHIAALPRWSPPTSAIR